jgi:hypothetical protein
MSEKEGGYVENHDAFIHSLYEITTTKARLKSYIKEYKRKQFRYE